MVAPPWCWWSALGALSIVVAATKSDHRAPGRTIATRVSLPIVNQLFTTFDPQADCDSPWFNPFQAWGKDAIVTPGILFRTTEEPPKIILCKFMTLKASLP